jgi:transposase
VTKKYIVTLTAEERESLGELLGQVKQGARRRKRARALLLADGGLTDEAIAEQVGMHRRGIEDLRKRFAEEGCKATVEGKAHGHRPRALQGEDETRLIALIRSPQPDGRRHWTLRLIRDAWTKLEGTRTKKVSHETIRQTLKKINLKPGGGNEASLQNQTPGVLEKPLM